MGPFIGDFYLRDYDLSSKYNDLFKELLYRSLNCSGNCYPKIDYLEMSLNFQTGFSKTLKNRNPNFLGVRFWFRYRNQAADPTL